MTKEKPPYPTRKADMTSELEVVLKSIDSRVRSIERKVDRLLKLAADEDEK